MLGIALLAAYLCMGLVAGEKLFARRGRMARVWLGLTLGLVMMLWLPSLWAFAFGFTKMANGLALATAGAMSAALYLFGERASVQPTRSNAADPPVRLTLLLVLPLTALFGFLQYTHYFREVGGALYVGQSTYGDICMHSAIITSLQNAPFPPEYSILPGNRLGYPFLADALSASMVLFGTPLSLSMTVPGTIMGGMVFWGFLMLAWKLTGQARAMTVAFFLLFFNGGFGFVYALDLVFEDSSAFRDIFTGYYLAPANMPGHNLYWVNLLCDMLLPQRTFLAGCAVFLPALYMLADAYAIREARLERGDAGGVLPERNAFFQLGLLAGATPMIHTHLFLALGLITVGMMAHSAYRERGVRELGGYLFYGCTAVIMALPQLLLWTIPQTAGAGGVKIWLGWVNNIGGRLRDETVWFWLKNMGLPFLLLVPAALQAKRRERAIAVGAACAFAVANVFQFQKLLYDNNKILYAAFIAVCPLLGAYLARIYDALKGVRARAYLAACVLTVALLSGVLSVGREIVSNYPIFSASEARAAEYLRSETPERAVVLAGGQHNNLASVLAGKNLVCGSEGFLSTHGLPYATAMRDARMMFERPEENEALFRQYSVAYVLISGHERDQYEIDYQWFSENAVCVYDDGLQIYSLVEDAVG